MRGCKLLCFLALTFLLLAGPVMGGVVEDAEETLKSVPTDNPSGKRFGSPTGQGRERFATPSNRVLETARTYPDWSGDVQGRGSSVARSGASSSRLAQPEVFASATPAPRAEIASGRQKREERDRADSATSLMGVLVLLALIAGAAVYSKRFGRDD
jgi:hypothetical protein